MLAKRITVTGVVQGVGFRPMVARLAESHGIRGWVRNSSAGVEIHAQGTSEELAKFVQQIAQSSLPMARIEAIEEADANANPHTDFRIVASRQLSETVVPLPVDLAACHSCLKELRDPLNRRHEYPYITCTDCGPRFSLIEALPFDRMTTTMAHWPMCSACRKEYEDPANRRFHAETICCPQCGPAYELYSAGHCLARGRRSIIQAGQWLTEGKIVAVKGIGGYHLACDATNPAAVAALRARKYRKERPFAVMARDLETARAYALLTAEHETLLESAARPIVLAPVRGALQGIHPDCRDIGIMLPYAPLHHLLFDHAPSLLVLTSGNSSGEPIAYLDDDAFERLGGVADAFLVGQRPIARRVDDSLVTVRCGKSVMIRRSRGFAPARVLRLPAPRPILAVGGELKNNVTLVVEGQAFVSQHLGDLNEDRTRDAFRQTVNGLLAVYRLHPCDVTLVHDLHPQYYSTRFAQSFGGREVVAVQHHHAHVAGVLAEHGRFEERVLGVALDGTGYGMDGTIWGGEILVGSLKGGFERKASLRPVKLLGGDAAASFPVQAAAGYLAELGALPDLTRGPFGFPDRFGRMLELVHREVQCFPATSAGRLFDAAAAIVGFIRPVTFEGQASMWLENLARESAPQEPFPLKNLDWGPMLLQMIRDRYAGRPIREIAYAFHAGLARGFAREATYWCDSAGVNLIALSGGVFQNDLFTELFRLEVERNSANAAVRPKIISNAQVPVNDGGLSLGQAALAVFEQSSGPPAFKR